MGSNASKKSLSAADYWLHLEQGDFHYKTLVKKNHEVILTLRCDSLAAVLLLAIFLHTILSLLHT